LTKTGRLRKRVSSAKKKRSRTDEPREEGGPDEAATFIAETSADLARLARRHKLDMLSHLLGMAQLEAEEHLRLRSKHKLSWKRGARTVLFLASDDASNIQAAEIFVDGGATGPRADAPIYRGWTRVPAKLLKPVSAIAWNSYIGCAGRLHPVDVFCKSAQRRWTFAAVRRHLEVFIFLVRKNFD
jgi:hypothetical protein